MRIFHRKQEQEESPGREVFGFKCDPNLAQRVRDAATLVQIPIYCISEHALELGLVHIGLEFYGDADNPRPAMDDLRSHLTTAHLLKDRLEDEEYEKEIVGRHVGLTPSEREQAKAVIDLIREFDGVPHEEVIDLVRGLVAETQERRKREATKRRLERDLDFRTLAAIERKTGLPGRLLKVISQYSLEEVAAYLYAHSNQDRECGGSPSVGRSVYP